MATQVAMDVAFEPLARESLADKLDTIPLFNALMRGEINRLSTYMVGYIVESDQVLISEGEQHNMLLLLVSGRISVCKGNGEVIKDLTTLRAGSFFGEMSVIDHYPPSATAITREISEILVLKQSNLDKLCDDHPRLGIKVIRGIAYQLSLRLRRTSGQLIGHL